MQPFKPTRFFKTGFEIIICLSLFIVSFAQKQRLKLTFSQDGKLLKGYTDRFRPNVNDNYIKDSSVQIEVLIDATFLAEDRDAIESIASAAYTALNDPNSILSQLTSSNRKTLKGIFQSEKDYNFDYDTDYKYVPKELSEYYSMLTALKSLKAEQLNSCKTLFPLRLYVGGQELQDVCMNFQEVNPTEDSCKCYDSKSNKVVSLVFNIPPSSFKDNDNDSFQLVRTFPLKDAAIDFIDTMIKDNKDNLPYLRIFDSTIASKSDTINKFYNELNEYLLFSKKCNEKTVNPCPETTDRQARIALLEQELRNLKNDLTSSISILPGKCDCSDSSLNSAGILGCKKNFLSSWIARLVWLNGDKIRLNPFRFTLTSRVSQVSGVDKDAAKIKIGLYDTAIVQLERRMAYRRLDSADEHYLDTLIANRKASAADLKKEPDTDNKNALALNAKNYNDFIVSNQILYKGWFIKYKPNSNKAYKKQKNWIRNYYLDNEDEPLREKLHYTYPENENVDLLVHNVPNGTIINTEENKKSFSDSATFTMGAGKVVGQAASLFSLVGGTVPGLRAALQFLNNNIEKKQAVKLSPIPAPNPLDPQEQKEFISKVKNRVDTARSFNLAKSNMLSIKRIDSIPFSVLFSTNEIGLYSVPITSSAKEQKKKLQNVINTIFLRNKKIYNSTIRELAASPAVKDTCFTKNTLAYVSALKQITNAPPLIDETIKQKKSTVPLYYTYKYKLSIHEVPYELDYKLTASSKNDIGETVTRFIDSSYIKVSKFQRLQLAAGLVLSPSAGVITSVDTSNGGFKINRDTDRFRLLVGLRWYPFGLYNQKEPASFFRDVTRDWRWSHRVSLLFATGIPKPLQNFYLGVGIDLVPGLCVSGGLHLQQNNRYTIQNNTVVNTQFRYASNSFVSLTIDPNLLVNAVKSIF